MRELIDRPISQPLTNPRSRLLTGIFRVLEQSGAAWCIPHGHENYVTQIPTDIDCIVSRELTPAKLLAMLHARRDELGARVVQWLSDGAEWFVLASDDPTPLIVQLHVSYDYELGSRIFYSGEEILDDREQHDGCWIASPACEFGCVLANRIFKCCMDERRQARLSSLFEEDPAGCTPQIERLFSAEPAKLIETAARTGDWSPIVRRPARLRNDLLSRRPRDGRPAQFGRRVKRWLNPPCGFHAVILGPDGVGKTTIIDAVRDELRGAFLRTDYFTFAPSLLPPRLQPRKKLPHELPPRGFPASILKAAWWAVCYWIGYPIVLRAAKCRVSLIFNHRHLLDAIVDPKRYRYSGPIWLLKLIWALSPKPDLVIALDADPQIVQSRKRELPLEEVARQRDAYRRVVQKLPIGRLVDASRPAAEVIAEVDRIILDWMARRVERRSGAEELA